jgi:ribonuclease HII
MQQHGFENPEYGVYFHKSYPTKEKDSQGYAGFGNQGRLLARINFNSLHKSLLK